MKSIDKIVTECLNSGDRNYVATAVNRIISEDSPVSAGDVVAVSGDPTFPYDGQKGRVKGISAKGAGYVDVQFENGQSVPLQSSLLIPIR